jgi:uncharacterized protein with FMN-binding domain
MAQSGSNKKAANNLVSASCAAVLAVYVAGYVKTQSAADRFSARVVERRAAIPERVSEHRQESPPLAEFRPAAQAVPVAAPAPAAAVVPHPRQPMPTSASAPAGAVEVRDSHIAPIAEMPSPAAVPAVALPEAAPVAIAAAAPAPPAPEAKVVAPAAPREPMWKDGTYSGWGYSRHGDIEATVVIADGRIASATISQCRTRYSCDVIDSLPRQVAQRQSPDVDYVSGATQSADAFYGAVVAALNKAK